MKSDDNTLWTVKDAADFLRVSRSWVYQRVASGTIPYLKIGGLVRFDPEAIRAFVTGASNASTGKVISLPNTRSQE